MGINWKLNPPGTFTLAGFGRQIKSICKILAGLCLEQRFTNESLSTFLSEVEYALNNWPRITVFDDPNDLEPLTSNQLLQQKQFTLFPTSIFILVTIIL